MTYSTLTAPWSYWQLLMPALISMVGLGMCVFALWPPRSRPEYHSTRVRVKYGLAAVLVFTFAGFVIRPVALATATCNDPSRIAAAPLIEGRLELLRPGKKISFTVDGQRFATWSSMAASECGLIDSLGQSVELHEGEPVMLKVVDGRVVWMESH